MSRIFHDTSHRQWLAQAGALAGAAVLPAAPAWAQGKGARSLRIGHQKGWLSILKARGTLEKRLAPLGASVSWTEFTAGPVQLEALNVGSIDFGDVGEAPPIFAQAAGAPLAYVGVSRPRPQLEAVLVPEGSSLNSVAALKGKKVALNKGSNVHVFLVKLLEKHGLRYSDVQTVFLPPADARAAFARGAVDAWAIWDPFYAAAEHTLKARKLADGTGLVANRQYYFSSRNYAAQNADLLKLALAEVEAIDAWAANNQSAAAQELAKVLNLPPEVTRRYLSRYQFGHEAVTPAILAEQQAIADTFHALKLIPRKLALARSV